MMDYYLKFTDEAHCRGVLFDGDSPKFRNIDIIGVIVRGDVALDGFHANVRLADGEDGASLEALAVEPANPVRVWA